MKLFNFKVKNQMNSYSKSVNGILKYGVLLIVLSLLAGCGTQSSIVSNQNTAAASNYDYVLGPGDVVDIFVWRNEELSTKALPIRPDGKISTPLVDELVAAGKTPKSLARDIEQHLARFIKDPYVTVTVTEFHGDLKDQIRVVGEATTPRALPFRTNISLLDVMIAVGGLTEFASGNRAKVVRTVNGKQVEISVRLEDLLRNGDISANIPMQPGDIVIVPESWF